MSDTTHHFDASADIIRRLGEELFTDSSQALLELVKNSYDADAQRVTVDVDTHAAVEGRQRSRGSIRIVDDGDGMTSEEIERGWLTLSFSAKREQKKQGRKTENLNRTPLGDKGLGRLGAQLLGSILTIRTRSRHQSIRSSVEHWVRIDFSRFRADRLLTEMTPEWEERPALPDGWPTGKPHGTVLTIEGLHRPDEWATEEALTRELGRLINPYREISDFALAVFLNEKQIEVEKLGEGVRDAALQRWSLTYDGTNLRLLGQQRQQAFRVKDPTADAALQLAMQTDRGAALRKRFAEAPGLALYEPEKGRGAWMIQLSGTLDVSDMDRPAPDCGPFEMEIDVVSRRFSQAREASLQVFDRAAEYSRWLKEHIGVQVYRDGFVVASGHDLLRLGHAFTSAQSFNALRPANVLGFVQISASDNPSLEETTDREGFRRTPQYVQFEGLLRMAVDAINRILARQGDHTVEYVAELVGAGGDDVSLEELEEIRSGLNPLEETISATRDAMSNWTEAGDYEELSPGRQELVAETSTLLDKANTALENLEPLLPLASRLTANVQQLKDRVDEYFQLIGIGIVAESVAHELVQVIDRLEDRAKLAEKELHRAGLDLPQVTALLKETVDGAKSIRGQLRHLDPQLTHARTRREAIDLGHLVEGVIEYHRERLAEKPIEVEFSVRDSAKVKVAPGRVMQVLDNLILNSEYWVQRQIDKGEVPRGLINVAVRGATVELSDNGPGIDPQRAEAVFEPFFTTRKGGRGLGLFIARQLLDADGGSVELQRGPHGKKMDSFLIDLTTAGGKT